MSVATFVQPDYTAQTPAAYKANLDHAAKVFSRLGTAFACHEQTENSPDAPDLTVRVDAGVIYTGGTTITTVAAQTSAAFTAPTVNPRYDIVTIDEATGTIGVTAGSEAASPADPSIPAGKLPVARVRLTVGMTEITNQDIDDLRTPLPPGLVAWLAGQDVGGTDTLARSQALLLKLEMEIVASFAGGMVDGHADPFESDTIAGTSSNETYDGTGDYYHNPGTSGRIANASAFGNLTSSGGLAGVFDQNTSTSGGRVATTGYAGQSWASPQLVDTVVVKSLASASYSGNNGGTSSVAVYGKAGAAPSGGTDGTLLYSGALTNAAGNVETITSADGLDVSTAYDHHWVLITNSYAEIQLAEAEFHQTSPPPDMTLVSATYTASVAPDSAQCVVLWKDDGSSPAPVVNTDFIVELTRVAAASPEDWVAVTLTDRGAWVAPDGATYRILDGVADLSGQASGTDMAIRARTLSNLAQRVRGWAFMWG